MDDPLGPDPDLAQVHRGWREENFALEANLAKALKDYCEVVLQVVEKFDSRPACNRHGTSDTDDLQCLVSEALEHLVIPQEWRRVLFRVHGALFVGLVAELRRYGEPPASRQ